MATTKRYDEFGQRVTSCCGCYSTYIENGTGHYALCCKKCYEEVEFGEGDGGEFKAGVTSEEYYAKAFAAEGI